jgi:hypothetical protein
LPGFHPFTQPIQGYDQTGIFIGDQTGMRDFVALAGKVLAELQATQADIIALNALLIAHTHASAVPVDPTFAGYAPHTPAPVAAASVKVT